GECEHFYRSVVMRGRMRVLSEPAEVRAAMRVLIGHLDAPDADKIWERTHLDTDKRLETFRALVFEIESTSAKQGK
ncbi:MAG: pyridoxamine 5'-phosphate oxidase family protein, partial [Actinobacteria bacterium]